MKALPVLAAVLLPLLFVTAGFAQESCRLGGNLPKPQHAAVDWQNSSAQTDYYALGISWSPQYCAEASPEQANRFQCIANRFGFVVHGLWPQSGRARSTEEHPRFCRETDLLSEVLIKKHLCTVPSVELLQSEWEKHGTCAFDNPEAYFTAIETLWQRLRKPDLRALLAQRGRRLTAGDVLNAFVTANRDAGLEGEDIILRVSDGNYLQEVVVCYDKGYRFQQCAMTGVPLRKKIRVHFSEH